MASKKSTVYASTLQQYGSSPTPKDLTASYSYNSFGLPVTYTATAGSLQRSTSTAYDAKGRFPVSQTNALGYTSVSQYDNKGNFIASTDVRGLSSEFKYNAFGEIIQQISPEGIVTNFHKDWTANLSGSNIPIVPDSTLYYKLVTSDGAPQSFAFYDKHGKR